MQIDVAFDSKSIQAAIEVLRKRRTMVRRATNWFLERSLAIIRSKAITNLKFLFPETEETELKAKLTNPESYVITKVSDTEYKMICTVEEGTYVEFGIGLIGQEQPHPKASEENYRYNLPSNAKSEKMGLPDAWYFKGKIMQGYSGTLFLYNAMMEYVNSGIYKSVWNTAIEKFIEE